MVHVKLNILLDWVSNNVKDFPLNGPLQLEVWQAVGQRLFINIASHGNAEACGHLPAWGTVTAVIKGNHVNTGHYVASEVDSPLPQHCQGLYTALRSTHTP